jgi:membrane protease YdiL (CAAX protease family)
MQEGASARLVSPLFAALWTVALFMVEQVCIELTEAARPGAATDLVNLAACLVLATSVVVFAMVRVHARETSLRWTLGMRPPGFLQVPLAVAAGAGLCPLTDLIEDAIVKRWPYDAAETALDEKILGASTMHERVVLVVALLVVIPIAHELFFRGILYTELRRAAGPQMAIATTSVFFATFAGEPRLMAPKALLGLALAVLRERTGTVVTPIIAVLALCSVEGIPILRGRDPMADVVYPTKWVIGGAVIALLAIAGAGAGRRSEE